MRVIGGAFGGRRLRAVEGAGTRPTSDRVREALFGRLESRYGLEGSVVLDAFAGTGALAIEAISRGASKAVCIEVDRRAMETLRGNLRAFALAGRVRVLGEDFRRMLPMLAAEGLRFEGAFVDPPYGKGLAVEALEVLAAKGLVVDGGWVAVETARREELPAVVGDAAATRLVQVRDDAYGDTRLALYEAEAAGRASGTVGPPTTGETGQGGEAAAEGER